MAHECLYMSSAWWGVVVMFLSDSWSLEFFSSQIVGSNLRSAEAAGPSGV